MFDEPTLLLREDATNRPYWFIESTLFVRFAATLCRKIIAVKPQIETRVATIQKKDDEELIIPMVTKACGMMAHRGINAKTPVRPFRIISASCSPSTEISF